MVDPREHRSERQKEILDQLPLTVTRITAQKKNSDRYSLFHEKKFLIGIGRKTRQDFSIETGILLTPTLYRQLTEAENLSSIREICYRYLARRDHSSSELRKKINKKGFNNKDIELIIEDLVKRGLLNDKEFAKKFAVDKMELNSWGPKKIRSELFKKGVDRKIINQIVENLAPIDDLKQICIDLVLKRKRHFLREEDLFKRKQKIYRYLVGRGFSSSIITSSLPEINKKLNA